MQHTQCVVDRGIPSAGITAVDQQKLFQRFVQGESGKTSSGGTGLGLYLSKQIIEAHHGEITCQSVFGKWD